MPPHPLKNFEIQSFIKINLHLMVLNMFLKKLKKLLEIKPSKLTFPDYNQTIQ